MNEIAIQSLEMAEECLNVNYYGPKRMIEALMPLLQLSDLPRVVNVSSAGGKLKVQKMTQNPSPKINTFRTRELQFT